MTTLQTKLATLKGIGPKKAEALAALGLQIFEDLLYYFPRRFEDRRGLSSFATAPAETFCAFKARVLSVTRTRSIHNRRMSILKARLVDEAGSEALGVWFNSYGLEHFLKQEGLVALWGKVTREGRTPQILSAEIEPIPSWDAPASIIGSLFPQYPLTAGISARLIKSLIDQALEHIYEAEDWLPKEICDQHNWPSLRQALLSVHRPHQVEDFNRARRRLAYGEFLLLQLALALRRHHVELSRAQPLTKDCEALRAQLLNALGFEFTAGQKSVLAQIDRDMGQTHPMNRLLQGDVGSGKTAVALAALLKAVANGGQGALMAPTSVLAEQHYHLAHRLLTPLGLRVEFFSGVLTPKERAQKLDDLKKGLIHIAVGTHALVQEGVTFANLALAVIDEQHRFGVMQRLTLGAGDALQPHRLLMTATPIPRTLALGIYGDLDLSVLKEKPAGRRAVKTRVIDHTKVADMLSWLRGETKAGRQAFWVCALIEESEKLSATPLLHRFEALQRALPDVPMAYVHGRMKEEEKAQVMSDFASGKVALLLSTTVIEVGVDVPKATVMVVENAERFGLSQLHQLRGRVGRGSDESWCFLLPGSKAAAQKLAPFAATDDGFAIAELDLQERGPGAFAGTRQSGVTDFHLGDLLRDGDLMEEARDDARRLVAQGAVKGDLLARVKKTYQSVIDIVEAG